MNDLVLRELARLQKKNGGILLAEKVFAAAEPEDSPLHSLFEWDREKAFIEHNLERARNLIQTFRIEYKDVIVEKSKIKIVESVGLPRWTPHPHFTRGYSDTQSLLSGPERKDTLLQEHSRCLGHVERLAGYLKGVGMEKEFRRLLGVMEDIRAAITGMVEDAVN